MPFVNRFISPLLTPPPSGSTLPTKSLSFASASTQYLSMSDANFGSFNTAKWAYSTWFQIATSGDLDKTFISQWDGTPDNSFLIQITSAGKISIAVSSTGSNVNGRLITTATWTTTNTWINLLFWFDSANGTPGDRMRLWINGTEITLFDTDTNPTAAVHDAATPMEVGGSVGDGTYFNGLLYQSTFWDGVNPDIALIYNSGHPVTNVGQSGVKSTLDVGGGSVVHDGVISTSWTNNNTVTSSATIPT